MSTTLYALSFSELINELKKSFKNNNIAYITFENMISFGIVQEMVRVPSAKPSIVEKLKNKFPALKGLNFSFGKMSSCQFFDRFDQTFE